MSIPNNFSSPMRTFEARGRARPATRPPGRLIETVQPRGHRPNPVQSENNRQISALDNFLQLVENIKDVALLDFEVIDGISQMDKKMSEFKLHDMEAAKAEFELVYNIKVPKQEFWDANGELDYYKEIDHVYQFMVQHQSQLGSSQEGNVSFDNPYYMNDLS